jgi:hypothetical protein
MAFNIRGRRAAYDNIAVGQATGRERCTGQTPSTELIGGGTGSSTDPGGATSGVGAKDYSNINRTTDGFNTSDPLDNIVAGTVTLRGERLGS